MNKKWNTKILRIDSEDIDISVWGEESEKFTRKVGEFLQLKANKKVSRINVIPVKEQQSKNIKTTTTKLFEMEIDFVNLVEESSNFETEKIQTSPRGSPKTDAFRRDLTINSLFYNINESLVEDFTEMGIDDLHHKILRTPLDPSITFTMDAARILRTFRFSCKYRFTLHPSISFSILKEGPNTPRYFLDKKITKDRIGTELLSMFRNKKLFFIFYFLFFILFIFF